MGYGGAGARERSEASGEQSFDRRGAANAACDSVDTDLFSCGDRNLWICSVVSDDFEAGNRIFEFYGNAAGGAALCGGSGCNVAQRLAFGPFARAAVAHGYAVVRWSRVFGRCALFQQRSGIGVRLDGCRWGVYHGVLA